MNDVKKAADLIKSLFDNIDSRDVRRAGDIFDCWRKTVSSVSGGQKLAEHTRIADLRNGVLHVETDHPGWIQLMQLHRKYLVEGLRRSFPELDIRTLSFRLNDGSSSGENTVRKLSRAEMFRKIEQEEQARGENRPPDGIRAAQAGAENANLAPLFEKLKKSMKESEKDAPRT